MKKTQKKKERKNEGRGCMEMGVAAVLVGGKGLGGCVPD